MGSLIDCAFTTVAVKRILGRFLAWRIRVAVPRAFNSGVNLTEFCSTRGHVGFE